MLGLARNLIETTRSEGLSRSDLASTYLRLRLGRFARHSSRRAAVLDYDVAYADYDELVTLFEEIFLRRHYPFVPKRPAPLVVDGGANIGLSTLFFKTIAPDATVLAFEPEPNAFALLSENVRANGLERVECVQAALAGESGTVDLNVVSGGGTGSSVQFEPPGATSVVVDAVTLSERIASRHVDFVKLDVEGSEGAVIDELSGTGALENVEEIAFEYHPGGALELGALLALLERGGYRHRIAVVGDRFWDREQLLLIHAYR